MTFSVILFKGASTNLTGQLGCLMPDVKSIRYKCNYSLLEGTSWQAHHKVIMISSLRVLARYEAQNRPLFYISFDIFINTFIIS